MLAVASLARLVTVVGMSVVNGSSVEFPPSVSALAAGNGSEDGLSACCWNASVANKVQPKRGLNCAVIFWPSMDAETFCCSGSIS